MQQLTEAIDKAAHDGKHMGVCRDEMRNAAATWADHALRTYDGDLCVFFRDVMSVSVLPGYGIGIGCKRATVC